MSFFLVRAVSMADGPGTHGSYVLRQVLGDLCVLCQFILAVDVPSAHHDAELLCTLVLCAIRCYVLRLYAKHQLPFLKT